MVLQVVLAARQIDEEAVRVVVVLRIGANLLADRLVHETGVTHVAVEEGTGSEALPVGELGCVEDDPSLLVGPALKILATDDGSEFSVVRIVLHHDPNGYCRGVAHKKYGLPTTHRQITGRYFRREGPTPHTMLY